MATDSSTNKSRLEAFINFCFSLGWSLPSIQGAAANAYAESHAYLETGDEFAPSKYFNYAVYGGFSNHAGHDWYSQGINPTDDLTASGGGAYGFFQYAPQDGFAAAGTSWNNFFPNGNSTQGINAQLSWFLNPNTGFAKSSWIAGGNMSYTTTPKADSNISYDEYVKNKNNNTAEELSNIWFVNFERGGASGYAGHNWEGGIRTLVKDWGIGWGSGQTPSTPTPSPTSQTPHDPRAKPCYVLTNQGSKPDLAAPSSGSGSSPATTIGDGGLVNRTIPKIANIIGSRVGWGAAFGQCYGLAQWWVSQCGGSGPSMVGGTGAAANIWSDFPWGSAGSWQYFQSGSGTPSGGWKTGDIVCFADSSLESGGWGHVGVVAIVSATGFTMYDQNTPGPGVSPIFPGATGAYNGPVEYYAANVAPNLAGLNVMSQIPNNIGNITGYVRPLRMPT